MLRHILLLCLALPAAAVAQDLPAPLGVTLSDFDDALTATEEAQIDTALAETALQTGVRIAVATMADIRAHGGGDVRVEDYAKQLFNAWGVGESATNTGILLLVVTKDRVVRIALGSGYDAVYDGRAQRVIDTAILPEFRNGQIAGGILAGIASLRERVIAPHLAGKPVTVDEGFPDADSPLGLIVAGGLFVAGAAAIALRRRYNARQPCPKCGHAPLTLTSEVLSAASDTTDGTGMRHMSCPKCGFIARESYVISARDTDRQLDGRRGKSGGGGSGFGGGKSSGGGATGRW